MLLKFSWLLFTTFLRGAPTLTEGRHAPSLARSSSSYITYSYKSQSHEVSCCRAQFHGAQGKQSCEAQCRKARSSKAQPYKVLSCAAGAFSGPPRLGLTLSLARGQPLQYAAWNGMLYPWIAKFGEFASAVNSKNDFASGRIVIRLAEKVRP